jgi:putative ABC transport system permease protein
MEQHIAASVSQRRFALLLILLFGAVALVLTALGLYGVLAYSVSQRTQEIGVRVALGATREDILRLVLTQASKMTAIGVACGIAVALGVARILSSQLFEIGPTDPLTFGVVLLLLLAVAAAASYVPVQRALRINPLTALRHE